MDFQTTVTIITSVLLAIAGFLFAYFNNLSLEKKKNRLERVNKQLNDFYGPLLAVVQSNQLAWDNFIAKYDNNPDFYKKKENPAPQQVAEFHHWMTTVFMPNNERLYEIIINQTSLLEEDRIPKVLLKLVAHVLEFRIIMDERKDEFGEVTETRSKYPAKELLEYCEKKFKTLKTEQSKLIKLTKKRKK